MAVLLSELLDDKLPLPLPLLELWVLMLDGILLADSVAELLAVEPPLPLPLLAPRMLALDSGLLWLALALDPPFPLPPLELRLFVLDGSLLVEPLSESLLDDPLPLPLPEPLDDDPPLSLLESAPVERFSVPSLFFAVDKRADRTSVLVHPQSSLNC